MIYIVTIVADALVPNGRKGITNHGAYGVIRTVIRKYNRIIVIKRTVLVRGWEDDNSSLSLLLAGSS